MAEKKINQQQTERQKRLNSKLRQNDKIAEFKFGRTKMGENIKWQ